MVSKKNHRLVPFIVYRIVKFYSRERNRIHARNTRERKRILTESTQQKLDLLQKEVN